MVFAIMLISSTARSRLLLVLALVLGLAVAIQPATAQEVTPESIREELAVYPELHIRATDEGLEVPSQVEAGRYLVVLENAGTHDHGAYLVQAPAGRTVSELAETTLDPEGPPDWLFDLTFLGGPGDVAVGQQARAIVDLFPGQYGVLDPRAAGSGEPNWLVSLEVIGDLNATPALTLEPPTDAVIEMEAFAFEGLPERVTPGLHVWEVSNVGEQPFEMAIAKTPEGTTAEEAQAAVMSLFGETPVPGTLDFEELVWVGGMASLSPGHTAWTVLDLEPGTYVVMDFFGAPMGMIGVFTVEA